MPSGSREVGALGRAVARSLDEARARSGRSLRSLAPETPVSFTQLGRILAGEKVMTMDEFGAICVALGLDPEDVFRDAVESVAAHKRAELRMVDDEADRDGTATSEAEAEELAPPLDVARREADEGAADGSVGLEGWAVAAHDPGTDPEAEAEAFGAL